jgi:hypothetical protein
MRPGRAEPVEAVSKSALRFFQVLPRAKDGFQRAKVQTELSNSELLAPDNVGIPAAAR